ncbi:MAG: M3 family metallopeptidase [Proteobacteria bacterium]|nr:M3 family metallopeptidase [Pseudomonadota bacterium]MDA0993771.1 M3 family metallopeptidase [Pseudomonadota bacterium]
MQRPSPIVGLTVFLLAAGCSGGNSPESVVNNTTESSNPFFVDSELPYGMPPFDLIRNEHFAPAFERGMAEEMTEVMVIVSNPEPASFDNTIVALELSGQLLSRSRRVFSSLTGAHTNDALKVIQKDMAPRFSSHNDSINLNPDLFARVADLYAVRETLGLDAESLRLLERYYSDFIRAGAQLSDVQKERLREINSELAQLGTAFSQNVLSEVNDSAIVVDSRGELAGLSDSQIDSAAAEASSRQLDGKFVLTLQNTTLQPLITSLENRALRQRIQETSAMRGSRGNEYDNRGIVTRVLELRSEKATLLGFESHAAFILENQTAHTVSAVNDMLGRLGPRAYANARKEAEDLQTLINETETKPFELASWDWLYYTEKLRQKRYDLDADQLKPYFEIDRVLNDGVFHSAEKLYGVTFEERPELPVYQEDVRVFEVFFDGEPAGLFIFDAYARDTKRGGAWMNAYVSQSRLLNERPVVANHLNVIKPAEGEPTLLTLDEVTTMFHEFGHALHGLFSDVNYPHFSGTSVPRDFVEYPSQVNEMWATWPEVLSNYAVHYRTGEPIPLELLEKVIAAQQFNEGFTTGEYLAAAIVDQALHQLPIEDIPPAEALMETQSKILHDAAIEFDAVPPRYSAPYFSHIMGGYSAGYYSYIWAEVLDADSVQWFRENGGLKRENGNHFRKSLLSKGGSVDAMELFRNFRGADPSIEPLLERRGLN